MFSFSSFIHTNSEMQTPHVEPISSDYAVSVNGVSVPVYTCRISRYPFNRVWTDHQRTFDQTVEASFVNLVSDEPLTLAITPKRPYKRVMLKPYSKQISVTDEGGVLTFTLSECGQFVLETDSYQHCLYIFNSKAITPPEEKDVTHYFGPGIHFAGKITLHSNESVYVDKDALVYGCFFAKNAENVRIFGNGLIDDSMEERISIHCYTSYTNGNLKFYDCKDLSIEGILMRNSAIWCVNVFHCLDVTLDGIKVFGQWRYNTDGVDIVNSQNVTIKNAFIHSFDDTITIKGIDEYAHTSVENITVEKCVLWCDWGKTCELGIETTCHHYRNITFRNCDILRAGNTALDIQNGDYAEISNVTFEDIRVEYNDFDTKEVYQYSDEAVYDAENTVATPHLFMLTNHRFRSPSNVAAWGISEKALSEELYGGKHPATIRNVTVRNIRVYYDEAIPKTNGKYTVPIYLFSSLADVFFEDILIENVTVNGVCLTADSALLEAKGVKNLRFVGDEDFTQLAKNTVKAENQLNETDLITFENKNSEGVRILFLGNSITRHGVKADIGWHYTHGMAASAKEKDYVHLTLALLKEKGIDAACCICQASGWEVQYKNGAEVHKLFASAKAFEADIIVMRLIENCPTADFDKERFKKELLSLLSYLSGEKAPKILLTTGFWQHPGNEAICELSTKHAFPLIPLSDLGQMDEMKALGLFEHEGVANHPGDKGMQAIADRIAAKIQEIL